MAPLFEDEDYTLLVNAQRQQLGKDLARWLHGYWSSHKQIYPIYDATLMRLCGAETEAIWKFRQLLREALAELEAAGFLAPGWTVGSPRPGRGDQGHQNQNAGQATLKIRLFIELSIHHSWIAVAFWHV